MEVDIGSSKSLVSWATIKRIVPSLTKAKLRQCPIRLRDYQGQPIPIVGCDTFNIASRNFQGPLPLIIMDGHLPSLLGLDRFSALGLSISGVPAVVPDSFAMLASKFVDVFDNKLGQHGIRHEPTALFHPTGNGLAEQTVQSAKEALATWGQKIGTTNCPNISWRSIQPRAWLPTKVLQNDLWAGSSGQLWTGCTLAMQQKKAPLQATQHEPLMWETLSTPKTMGLNQGGFLDKLCN
ncbi:PREDICTED: uncharacterized protein LOC106556905 [Thamnophis sirtalis]|uniref:Uncharacterized protein LOC106556905 n=1 Tax=Thamnophis sirtalis TaxID=35019 RepID=A0A6I9Z2V3_9SAUR|nr:PREDICTED: uncharacterized protein LOC106556905 [Thamnophis sirtalis]